MSLKNLVVLLSSSQVKQYCINRNINSLGLTGSFVDGSHTDMSDVDIVYTKNNDNFSLLDKYDVQDFLSSIVHRSVDMISLVGLIEPIKSNMLSKYVKIF